MNHKIILLLNKEGEVKNYVLRINKFIIEFEFNYKVEKKREIFSLFNNGGYFFNQNQ